MEIKSLSGSFPGFPGITTEFNIAWILLSVAICSSQKRLDKQGGAVATEQGD